MAALLSRDKWYRTERPLAKGELVLIKVENRKQQTYPLAIVDEVITSQDGLVRTYVVRTSNGKLYRRDTNFLCRLEIDQQFEFESLDDIPTTREPHQRSRLFKDHTPPSLEGPLVENGVVRTRTGRISRKPDRFSATNT